MMLWPTFEALQRSNPLRTTDPISGFVLAGGKSSRMGQDKALLNWRGRTLVEHMVELLSSVTRDVRVVGRPPLPDVIEDCGPLGGIATALQTSQTDANLVVAVDLPFLIEDFLKYFASRLDSCPSAVLACSLPTGVPICLGLRRSILPLVTHGLSMGQRSVSNFISSVDSKLLSAWELESAGFGPSMFRNVNTPEDYLNAQLI
jgi:molybdenum cofactor guanylyltransferase